MIWLYNEFMNVVMQLIGAVMQVLTNSFLSSFGPNVVQFNSSFFRGATGVLRAVGMALVVLIVVGALCRNFLAPITGEMEDPVKMIPRAAISLFLVFYTGGVIQLEFKFFSKVYSAFNQISMFWDPKKDAEQIKSAFLQLVSSDHKISQAINIALSSVKLDVPAKMVYATIAVVMLLVVGIDYLKLLLEGAERYVVCFLLFWFAPLGGSTFASKSTEKVFFSYIRMGISQLLLLCFNVLFLRGALGLMVGFNSVNILKSDSFIIKCILVAGFCKAGLQIDQYMRSLGLDVVQTGNDLMGEIFSAAKLAMGKNGVIAGAKAMGAAAFRGFQTGGFKGMAEEMNKEFGRRVGADGFMNDIKNAKAEKTMNDLKNGKKFDGSPETAGDVLDAIRNTNKAYGDKPIPDENLGGKGMAEKLMRSLGGQGTEMNNRINNAIDKNGLDDIKAYGDGSYQAKNAEGNGFRISNEKPQRGEYMVAKDMFGAGKDGYISRVGKGTNIPFASSIPSNGRKSNLKSTMGADWGNGSTKSQFGKSMAGALNNQTMPQVAQSSLGTANGLDTSKSARMFDMGAKDVHYDASKVNADGSRGGMVDGSLVGMKDSTGRTIEEGMAAYVDSNGQVQTMTDSAGNVMSSSGVAFADDEGNIMNVTGSDGTTSGVLGYGDLADTLADNVTTTGIGDGQATMEIGGYDSDGNAIEGEQTLQIGTIGDSSSMASFTGAREAGGFDNVSIMTADNNGESITNMSAADRQNVAKMFDSMDGNEAASRYGASQFGAGGYGDYNGMQDSIKQDSIRFSDTGGIATCETEYGQKIMLMDANKYQMLGGEKNGHLVDIGGSSYYATEYTDRQMKDAQGKLRTYPDGTPMMKPVSKARFKIRGED